MNYLRAQVNFRQLRAETAGNRYLRRFLPASAGIFTWGSVNLRPSQIFLHAPVLQCTTANLRTESPNNFHKIWKNFKHKPFFPNINFSSNCSNGLVEHCFDSINHFFPQIQPKSERFQNFSNKFFLVKMFISNHSKQFWHLESTNFEWKNEQRLTFEFRQKTILKMVLWTGRMQIWQHQTGFAESFAINYKYTKFFERN